MVNFLSRREKLIERFLSVPVDFTYSELITVLGYFGYSESTAGKTSGSAVKFVCGADIDIIRLHKPHPGNIVKRYSVESVITALKEAGKI